MTQKSDFSFFHPLRVRYSEVDAQAVVYNSHYVTYFDIAITEFFRTLDFEYSITAVQRTGKDFHTVKVTVEFQQPTYYDDELLVGVRVARIGRSSLTWSLAVFRKAEIESLAQGDIVWVYTDMTTHRSTPLPEALLDELAAAQQGLKGSPGAIDSPPNK